jgi:hypothetical protein
MEFSMRNHISLTALGVALLAGASVADAQTVIAPPAETVIAPQPGATVIAQQPAPAETVETVRTVQSTTTPRRTVASRTFTNGRTTRRVTTTRATTVRRGTVTAPAAAAIMQPTYTEVVPGPVASTYPAPLYDVVPGAAIATPALVAQPAVGAPVISPAPAYRYVYEPDRILVIDPYSNIAVQSIPR